MRLPPGSELIEPNIYSLPSGGYLVWVTARRRGRRVFRSRRFVNISDARTFRARWQTAEAFESAGLIPPRPRETPVRQSLGELTDAVIKAQEAGGRSEKTLQESRQLAGILARALGRDCPAPLRDEDVGRLIAWFRNPENSKSRGALIAKTLGMVGRAHRRARLPVPRWDPVPVEIVGRRMLTPTELRRWLAELPLGSVARTHAEIVLWTACRESEARRMTVSDIDIEEGIVLIPRRKGWRRAGIRREEAPLPKELRPAMKAYLKTLPAGLPPDAPFLAVGDARESLDEQTLRPVFEAASRRAGITPEVSGVGWLRNFAATAASEEEVPVETTRRVLGHADSRTTERHYDRALRWRARAEVQRAVAAALRGATRGLPPSLKTAGNRISGPGARSPRKTKTPSS